MAHVFLFLVAILLFFVASEEEMQRRTLNFDNRMEAAKCNDGHGFRVVPAQ